MPFTNWSSTYSDSSLGTSFSVLLVVDSWRLLCSRRILFAISCIVGCHLLGVPLSLVYFRVCCLSFLVSNDFIFVSLSPVFAEWSGGGVVTVRYLVILFCLLSVAFVGFLVCFSGLICGSAGVVVFSVFDVMLEMSLSMMAVAVFSAVSLII